MMPDEPPLYCEEDLRDAFLTEWRTIPSAVMDRSTARMIGFVVHAGFEGGLRKNEIIEARPNWFFIREQNSMRVSKTDTFIPKGKKPRDIPMTDVFSHFMREFLTDHEGMRPSICFIPLAVLPLPVPPPERADAARLVAQVVDSDPHKPLPRLLKLRAIKKRQAFSLNDGVDPSRPPHQQQNLWRAYQVLGLGQSDSSPSRPRTHRNGGFALLFLAHGFHEVVKPHGESSMISLMFQGYPKRFACLGSPEKMVWRGKWMRMQWIGRLAEAPVKRSWRARQSAQMTGPFRGDVRLADVTQSGENHGAHRRRARQLAGRTMPQLDGYRPGGDGAAATGREVDQPRGHMLCQPEHGPVNRTGQPRQPHHRQRLRGAINEPHKRHPQRIARFPLSRTSHDIDTARTNGQTPLPPAAAYRAARKAQLRTISISSG